MEQGLTQHGLADEEFFNHVAGFLEAKRFLVKSKAPELETDEILQAAFSEAAEAWEKDPLHLGTVENLDGYLWTIVARLIGDALKGRQQKRQQELSVNTDRAIVAKRLLQLPDVSGDPLEGMIREETLKRLSLAMLGIPKDWRRVLVLRYVEGMEKGAIATLMGIPESTVTNRLKWARSRLRVALKERETAHEKDHRRASRALRDGPSGFQTLPAGRNA